jgi:hypothetical protein
MSNETRFVYRRPKWGRGMITEEDARFLHDLILELHPSVAIELGVASGCSSAVILEAMRQYHEPGTPNANPESRIPNPGPRIPDAVWLHAFDISERCYFDPAHPSGDAVAELTPWNVSRYNFATGDVLLARERLAGLNAPFAFIDANHLHPWATADLIGLLPTLAPGAWVGLHDIRLPFVPGRTDTRGHGPRHLFETWPLEKRQGGTDDNIGAIRLPENVKDVREIVQASLRRPWEVALPAAVCTALGIKPHPIGLLPKPDALRTLKEAAARQRPLYVCGSGQAGRALANELRRRDVKVTGFVDRDPAKHGEIVDGLRVACRSQLSFESNPKPFMVLAGMFATEIDAELAASGWRRGKDFVVVW